MVSETALTRIDEIAAENLLATVGGGKMSQAITVANRMTELRELLTKDVLTGVASLQGSDIGFRTDKDGKGGYDLDVIRDVTIEATLRGYALVGNEINIIAGRFYAARNGLERKVAEFPGLSDLKMKAGVPHRMSEGALVEYHAQWKLNGVEDAIDCEQNGASDTRIPVRVNAGMGTDAILGKAERKMLARIYKRLTGSVQSIGESEMEAEEVAEAIVETIVEQTEQERDQAVVLAQEAIDACTSRKDIAAAFASHTDKMCNEDVDIVAKYAERKMNKLKD